MYFAAGISTLAGFITLLSSVSAAFIGAAAFSSFSSYETTGSSSSGGARR